MVLYTAVTSAWEFQPIGANLRGVISGTRPEFEYSNRIHFQLEETHYLTYTLLSRTLIMLSTMLLLMRSGMLLLPQGRRTRLRVFHERRERKVRVHGRHLVERGFANGGRNKYVAGTGGTSYFWGPPLVV